ncbi:beta-amylase [Marchantia polymorpha subsp. ruderalis]|uniref:Beta-amylase n=4 Tax=Marchantia polymorpha TaxID=3197 RepID=A0AAF6BE16_MARPO|nr:hypothetical protein MARPO_0147s0005 [Marchantia polymorpha]BBN10250.1 hypothetical protein Mp_5g02130 [Marchantia polymorpha subsp. ruderalis]|eukprot:PTQ29110.1 hypothetical protein MARPO_0147s0005 [Marchantia polymorpha]
MMNIMEQHLEHLDSLDQLDTETGSDSDMLALTPAQSGQERKSRRGGRPRSLVWQHFIVSGERTDKSRRFNVCCKSCGIDMVSRLGTMEKHIAFECEKADPDGRVKIQERLAVKSAQIIGHAAKRVKKEGRRKLFEVHERDFERDFAGTTYIPIYVMLPLNTIDENNEVSDPEFLKYDLRALKSVNVDGVMVDCWWGLVEGKAPQHYNWNGYRQLFNIVREAGLKLQVVMSFHQCGGNVGDDTNIPIPSWVLDIGEKNPDIFFTDRQGVRNPECLSWGVDKERVLAGRTGLEIYYDFMRSFRSQFDEFFEDGTITEIEVGLGACGELRYPSYPERHGWKYPGIGEFQVYDKYLQKSLTKAAVQRGHGDWARAPDNAGEYNSRPQDTGFFRDGGDYDSYYGRFFLKWYSQVLIEHGDNVLTLANLAFEGYKIAAKVSGIHWWYKTASHAAELAAGFYNPSNRDGYAPIAEMLAKHKAALNFTCVELRTSSQEEGHPEAMADPEGLVWQVLNAAWDSNISVASENALPCYDRDGYNKILENAKPLKDPDGRHLVAFTYLRLNPTLMEDSNLDEFALFVKRLHGESIH